MKLIKLDVLLSGNLGFRQILLVYAVLGIIPLETIKETHQSTKCQEQ